MYENGKGNGIMNDSEKLTLWVGAFRYYCGRQTAAVADFCDLLIREWDSLPDRIKFIIKRDLEEEFKTDDADRASGNDWKRLGHDCDRAAWEKVRALWSKKD